MTSSFAFGLGDSEDSDLGALKISLNLQKQQHPLSWNYARITTIMIMNFVLEFCLK